ncbi:cytoplasmic protein [Suillus subalutaceus]|uniref:cytoplasmic protein n=1 Tax=Suillus subalutaceus TaxID=48586 RepID=UPI001B86C709|nr:cytoplasmic protein [Suillus subalutaceus]KAG1847306.1 cytoplasmic protein [Suillus subalutaceus]
MNIAVIVVSIIFVQSTVIRPLDQPFTQTTVSHQEESSLLDQEDEDDDRDDAAIEPSFSFPDLDERITSYQRIWRHVYILSKSSDFVSHDLSVESDTVFEGCQCDYSSPSSYQLELMCFVREGRVSQRDTNFYDFVNEPEARQKIIKALQRPWENGQVQRLSYAHRFYEDIVDLLMTRGLSRGHVFDFKPYHSERIPSYSREKRSCQPSLGAVHLSSVYINSPSHPVTRHNAPPSSGQNIDEFSDLWKEIQQSIDGVD